MNKSKIWSAVIVFRTKEGMIGAANAIASSEAEAMSSALREVPERAILIVRNAIGTGVEFIEDDLPDENYLPEIKVILPPV